MNLLNLNSFGVLKFPIVFVLQITWTVKCYEPTITLEILCNRLKYLPYILVYVSYSLNNLIKSQCTISNSSIHPPPSRSLHQATKVWPYMKCCNWLTVSRFKYKPNLTLWRSSIAVNCKKIVRGSSWSERVSHWVSESVSQSVSQSVCEWVSKSVSLWVS